MRLRAELSKASPRRALVYSALGAIACGLLDLSSGPEVQFPITYVVPVLVVAWHGSLRAGLVLAVLLALTRTAFESLVWSDGHAASLVLLNTLIRGALLATVALLAYVAGLSVRRVAMLEGILPICSHCKRIRDEHDEWHAVESYVTERSNAVFSHGICPACLAKHYETPAR